MMDDPIAPGEGNDDNGDSPNATVAIVITALVIAIAIIIVIIVCVFKRNKKQNQGDKSPVPDVESVNKRDTLPRSDSTNRKSIEKNEILLRTPSREAELYVVRHHYQKDSDNQLTLEPGRIIEVLEKLDTGWWRGVVNDEEGWFPAEYVRRMDVSEKANDTLSGDLLERISENGEVPKELPPYSTVKKKVGVDNKGFQPTTLDVPSTDQKMSDQDNTDVNTTTITIENHSPEGNRHNNIALSEVKVVGVTFGPSESDTESGSEGDDVAVLRKTGGERKDPGLDRSRISTMMDDIDEAGLQGFINDIFTIEDEVENPPPVPEKQFSDEDDLPLPPPPEIYANMEFASNVQNPQNDLSVKSTNDIQKHIPNGVKVEFTSNNEKEEMQTDANDNQISKSKTVVIENNIIGRNSVDNEDVYENINIEDQRSKISNVEIALVKDGNTLRSNKSTLHSQIQRQNAVVSDENSKQESENRVTSMSTSIPPSLDLLSELRAKMVSKETETPAETSRVNNAIHESDKTIDDTEELYEEIATPELSRAPITTSTPNDKVEVESSKPKSPKFAVSPKSAKSDTGSTGSKRKKKADKMYVVMFPFNATHREQMSLSRNDVVYHLEETPNGWLKGKKKDSEDTGWFPKSYVREGRSPKKSFEKSFSDSDELSEGEFDDDEEVTGLEYRAMYSYSGSQEGDLVFEKGATIVVLENLDTGWWRGYCGQDHGWFPGSYVEPLSAHTPTTPDSGLGSAVHMGLSDLKLEQEITSSSFPSLAPGKAKTTRSLSVKETTSSTVDVSTNYDRDSRISLPPKPDPPKRFVIPKMVKVPRSFLAKSKKSGSYNVAGVRPPRPAPPKPPALKLKPKISDASVTLKSRKALKPDIDIKSATLPKRTAQSRRISEPILQNSSLILSPDLDKSNTNITSVESLSPAQFTKSTDNLSTFKVEPDISNISKSTDNVFAASKQVTVSRSVSTEKKRHRAIRPNKPPPPRPPLASRSKSESALNIGTLGLSKDHLLFGKGVVDINIDSKTRESADKVRPTAIGVSNEVNTTKPRQDGENVIDSDSKLQNSGENNGVMVKDTNKHGFKYGNNLDNTTKDKSNTVSTTEPFDVTKYLLNDSFSKAEKFDTNEDYTSPSKPPRKQKDSKSNSKAEMNIKSPSSESLHSLESPKSLSNVLNDSTVTIESLQEDVVMGGVDTDLTSDFMKEINMRWGLGDEYAEETHDEIPGEIQIEVSEPVVEKTISPRSPRQETSDFLKEINKRWGFDDDGKSAADSTNDEIIIPEPEFVPIERQVERSVNMDYLMEPVKRNPSPSPPPPPLPRCSPPPLESDSEIIESPRKPDLPPKPDSHRMKSPPRTQSAKSPASTESQKSSPRTESAKSTPRIESSKCSHDNLSAKKFENNLHGTLERSNSSELPVIGHVDNSHLLKKSDDSANKRRLLPQVPNEPRRKSLTKSEYESDNKISDKIKYGLNNLNKDIDSNVPDIEINPQKPSLPQEEQSSFSHTAKTPPSTRSARSPPTVGSGSGAIAKQLLSMYGYNETDDTQSEIDYTNEENSFDNVDTSVVSAKVLNVKSDVHNYSSNIDPKDINVNSYKDKLDHSKISHDNYVESGIDNDEVVDSATIKADLFTNKQNMSCEGTGHLRFFTPSRFKLSSTGPKFGHVQSPTVESETSSTSAISLSGINSPLTDVHLATSNSFREIRNSNVKGSISDDLRNVVEHMFDDNTSTPMQITNIDDLIAEDQSCESNMTNASQMETPLSIDTSDLAPNPITIDNARRSRSPLYSPDENRSDKPFPWHSLPQVRNPPATTRNGETKESPTYDALRFYTPARYVPKSTDSSFHEINIDDAISKHKETIRISENVGKHDNDFDNHDSHDTHSDNLIEQPTKSSPQESSLEHKTKLYPRDEHIIQQEANSSRSQIYSPMKIKPYDAPKPYQPFKRLSSGKSDFFYQDESSKGPTQSDLTKKKAQVGAHGYRSAETSPLSSTDDPNTFLSGDVDHLNLLRTKTQVSSSSISSNVTDTDPENSCTRPVSSFGYNQVWSSNFFEMDHDLETDV